MKRRLLEKQPPRTDEEVRVGTASPPTIPSDPLPDSLARWTGNLLYWVANMGAQYHAEVIASLGLVPAHVAVLQVLDGEGTLRQARLTDKTRIDKATMVGLLNELERQGLTERIASPDDKRAFDVHLTEKGKAKVEQIEQISKTADEQFYGVLSPEERAVLRTYLQRLATRSAPE